MQIQGSLKEGDKFCTKEECVRAIKKYHMELSANYRVDRTNATRYKIYCRNELCVFRLSASYQKRSDSWEIGLMGLVHTYLITNPMQDHRKVISQLICDEILSIISDNPSLKVSITILHIITQYNYTSSYMKAWIARTKAVEKVFDNWEESYKELPKYSMALKHYAPRTIVSLEMLSAYTPDGTCVSGNDIFHRRFWAYQPASKVLLSVNLLYKLMLHGCTGSIMNATSDSGTRWQQQYFSNILCSN